MAQTILENIGSTPNYISCKHANVILDDERGEEICSVCAQVLQDHVVDYSKDAYGENFENSSIGPKSTLRLPDRGLSTTINDANVDSQGKRISLKAKGMMYKVRTLNSRTLYRNSDKNLRTALIELEKLKGKMTLSDPIVERAAYFYRKARSAGLQRTSIRGTIGACVYAACKDMSTTRTIIEIANHLHERRTTVAKKYRDLFQRLSLKSSFQDPQEIIIKVANNLDISERTKREAFLMLEQLKKQNMVAGKKPAAVAATVLYMAGIKTLENRSQEEISKAAGISCVTIRNRINEFVECIPLH